MHDEHLKLPRTKLSTSGFLVYIIYILYSDICYNISTE